MDAVAFRYDCKVQMKNRFKTYQKAPKEPKASDHKKMNKINSHRNISSD